MTKPEFHDTSGNFVSYSATYDQPSTIQHWQLRDLLSFGSDDVHVYSVNAQKIQRFNLATRTAELFASSKHVSSGPGPTSMTVQGNYLATGTEKGLLTVYNIGTSEKTHRKIFEEVVVRDVLNALHIVSEGNNTSARLYASLNDKTVRCYSLPYMSQIAVLKHDVPVNYCAESSDGSCLISVGDSSVVNVYHRDSCGQFTLTAALASEANDSGMCCAWNPWGSTFATAHQCGHVLIWDARLWSGRAVASIEVGNAVRSVKFCAAPVDLLAFSEHDGAFHVVDARKFGTRQTVRHPDTTDCGISGMAFSPGGSRLLVGIENRGIQEWAVDSAGRRGFSASMAS